MTYTEFLQNKAVAAPVSGFAVRDDEIHPALLPHQRIAVAWAVAGGRRALFESFGLGKTLQQLEYCRLVLKREGGKALIITPLGVRQEFVRDATELLGMDPPQYVTCRREVLDAPDGAVLLTNYERVREGDLVLDPFGGLMTVPMTAVKKGRRGYGVELNPDYFRDGVGYLQAAEDEIDTPTMFDLLEQPI